MYLKLRLCSSAWSQTTHSFLDFGPSRVRDSVLSQSPSQSQSSSAIHARGMQTTQDPSTHYNRVILDGCVEAVSVSLGCVSPSHSPSPAWKRQSESERVLSNLSKILEIRNSPSLLPSLPPLRSSCPLPHPFDTDQRNPYPIHSSPHSLLSCFLSPPLQPYPIVSPLLGCKEGAECLWVSIRGSFV